MQNAHRRLQWPAAGRAAVYVPAQARVVPGCRRADYNDARPHSQLGWKTPFGFVFTCRDLALRYAKAPRQLVARRSGWKAASIKVREFRWARDVGRA
ncbi:MULTISPECIES: transposase [Bradyrhizobium]